MDFKYPYTDFHELNLDWFLAEFKKLTTEWLAMQEGWADEQQAFQDLHDYVENYFANLDLYQEVHDVLWSPEMQGNIQIILSGLTTNMLPSVVADQITAVVASQISTVVALQLPAVVADKLPDALPAAVAGEAAAWLEAHVDPDTGYVIDKTLTIGTAAADAKTVGDIVYPLTENGVVNINCLSSPLQSLSTMNSAGSVAETVNPAHFSTNPNSHSVTIQGYMNKIVIKTDHTLLTKIRYVFRDYSDNNIGSVVNIDSPTDDIYQISIPSGAYYFNVGFIALNSTARDQGIAVTQILSNQSFFTGKMDTALTSTDLPAEGKATGTRLTAIENVLTNSDIRFLRIITTIDNIKFTVRTALTNLFLGYGSGLNNDDTAAGDDGKYNTAVGFEAFNRNTSGDHCTAVGYCSMKFNTTGDFNTALGEDSLYMNTAGSNNIAIGTHAGQHIESSNNTVIGSDVARYVNNLGNDNIAIGKEAMCHADGVSNNIAIGNNNLEYTTVSNQISIGNNTHTSVTIAGKKINFNVDGTVTWE